MNQGNIVTKTIIKDIYKMNRLPLLLLFSLLLFSSSCFTQKTSLPEDYSIIPLELPFEVLEVKIVDERDTPLKPMDWKLPSISVKKQEWVGNPPLSEINKKDIESIIHRSSKTGGIAANFEFRVLEGECKIYVDWKSAKEYTTFMGELYIEIPNDNLSFTSHAKLSYENPTWNATEEHTLDLYNLTVRNATHSILQQAKEGL